VCQVHGTIDKVEYIPRGNQPVLGTTRAEVVSNSRELPSIVELVMCTLCEWDRQDNG
jgi:hypothetical protein